ncbi:hypothetical protein RHECNPAF_850051 [Rhizobium etli CNPAF512]|nr:hypothetical protein RHECNPAF_850051 [Rhizobium etli CNPAF512]
MWPRAFKNTKPRSVTQARLSSNKRCSSLAFCSELCSPKRYGNITANSASEEFGSPIRIALIFIPRSLKVKREASQRPSRAKLATRSSRPCRCSRSACSRTAAISSSEKSFVWDNSISTGQPLLSGMLQRVWYRDQYRFGASASQLTAKQQKAALTQCPLLAHTSVERTLRTYVATSAPTAAKSNKPQRTARAAKRREALS